MPPKSKKTKTTQNDDDDNSKALVPSNQSGKTEMDEEKSKEFVENVWRKNITRAKNFETCVKLTAVLVNGVLVLTGLAIFYSLATKLVDIYVQEKQFDGALRREMAIRHPELMAPDEGYSYFALGAMTIQAVSVIGVGLTCCKKTVNILNVSDRVKRYVRGKKTKEETKKKADKKLPKKSNRDLTSSDDDDGDGEDDG